MEKKLETWPNRLRKYILANYGSDEAHIVSDMFNEYHPHALFLKNLNQELKIGELLIFYAETHTVRKKRILKKFLFPLNYLYYTADFLLTRVSPKLKLTKNLYHALSHKSRVLSKTEILGRLYYFGFEVIEEINLAQKLVIVARKKQEFEDQGYVPNEGLLIKLPRIGKNGKLIKVYKFRTMHPYSEFIQAYVYEKNQLKEGGKLDNDFRINTIGRFMRKYWIDEWPMLINILKGDMKLIGVRPLSQHYMSLYDQDLQELRQNCKPGLLPPFYADMPSTLEEIQNSERAYLKDSMKNPLITDLKYLYRILYNILIKKERSS